VDVGACHAQVKCWIYTLYLQDALPIDAQENTRKKNARKDRAEGTRDWCAIFLRVLAARSVCALILFATPARAQIPRSQEAYARQDRKSTRLNSSHEWNSYAVFCFKQKR